MDPLDTLICVSCTFQDKNELIYDLRLKSLTSEKKTMARVAFLDGSVKRSVWRSVAISY